LREAESKHVVESILEDVGAVIALAREFDLLEDFEIRPNWADPTMKKYLLEGDHGYLGRDEIPTEDHEFVVFPESETRPIGCSWSVLPDPSFDLDDEFDMAPDVELNYREAMGIPGIVGCY
jgi:hypothetical protein